MCSVLHCKQPQWPGDSLRKYEGGLKQQGECQVLGTPALPTFSHPIGLAYLHPLGHKQRPYPFSASSVKCRAATKREVLGLCVGCGHLLLFTADCPGCGGTDHTSPTPSSTALAINPTSQMGTQAQRSEGLAEVAQSGLPLHSLPRKMTAEQPRPPP